MTLTCTKRVVDLSNDRSLMDCWRDGADGSEYQGNLNGGKAHEGCCLLIVLTPILKNTPRKQKEGDRIKKLSYAGALLYMRRARSLGCDGFKFNTVGVGGAACKLCPCCYSALRRFRTFSPSFWRWKSPYLHNFVWHEAWTWRGKPWRIAGGDCAIPLANG